MTYFSFLRHLILSPGPFFHMCEKDSAERKKLASYSLFFYVGLPLFLGFLGFFAYLGVSILKATNSKEGFAKALIWFSTVAIAMVTIWTWLSSTFTHTAIRLANGRTSPETYQLIIYLGARLYVLCLILYVLWLLFVGHVAPLQYWSQLNGDRQAGNILFAVIFILLCIWALVTQVQASRQIIPLETGCTWWVYEVMETGLYTILIGGLYGIKELFV